jgi:3-methyladenine DNA glycosylase AlkD
VTANQDLIAAVRSQLEARAHFGKAAGMQAYMKSTMPYLGVPAPQHREAMKAAFQPYGDMSIEDWQDTVLTLWREAEFREERYAAIALTGLRVYSAFQSPEIVPMYEEMVVDGAWWDYVDAIATRRIGPLLVAYPEDMARRLLDWANGHNMWKRRSAIISQVVGRDGVDMPLLFRFIEPSLDSREFFLRKAIGWALRELAKQEPDTVERYVEENCDRLSGLSKREAIRGIAFGIRRRERNPVTS